MSDDSVCKASAAAASQPPAELIPGTKLEHFPNTDRKQSWPQSPSQELLITAEDALCCLISHNGMWNTLFPVVLCRKWISFVSAVIRFPDCVITCLTKPRFKWLSWAQCHELIMSSFLVGLAAWLSLLRRACYFVQTLRHWLLSVLSCCFIQCEPPLITPYYFSEIPTIVPEGMCRWLETSIIDWAARKLCRNNINDSSDVKNQSVKVISQKHWTCFTLSRNRLCNTIYVGCEQRVHYSNILNAESGQWPQM